MRLRLPYFILSVSLLTFSILIPNKDFFVWFAFVPYFYFIDQSSGKESFFAGLILGTVFFGSLFYWIVKYELRIFVLVLIVSIPFFGFLGWLTHLLWNNTRSSFLKIITPPIVWSIIYLIYSFTPFDTLANLIAFLQAPHFPGIVRNLGLSGFTFIVLLGNSLIFSSLKKESAAWAGMIAIFLLLYWSFYSRPQYIQTIPIRTAVVQHNFPIEPSWRFKNKDFVLQSYRQTASALGIHNDLVVFPQYGLPIDALREPKTFNELVKTTKGSVLLATYLPKTPGGSLESGPRTDSALLFSAGLPVQEYQAITPPPFRHIGQIRGQSRKTIKLKSALIGIMLCYEDVRSEEARRWVLNGSEILFALSNPGHFLKTRLSEYHLVQDQIRAIETGKYVVRASPNGYSAIVDPNGKIVIRTALEEASIITGMVYSNNQRTFFVRYGYLFPVLFGILGLGRVSYYVLNSIKRFARNTR